jgi:hypothetical protein
MDFFHQLWNKAGLDMELGGWEQFVLGLSAKARQAFGDVAMLAEGNGKKLSQNKGRKNDILRLAFFLTGKYPTTQNSARDCEQICMSAPRKWTRTIVTEEQELLQPVWCPQTELGTWVMRQNRQIVITGNSYVWALRMILGLPVQGFIYHEQKKGFPQPPKENTNRRLGRLFSVAKNQDTDYDTYLAHIKEHDTEAFEEGLYDDMLAFLKNEGIVFFKRHVIYKTDAELQEIGYNIGQEAIEMIDPAIRIYPNAGRFACKFCAFRMPCLGKNAHHDYNYTLATLYKKEPPYWYRQARGASTESKGGE